MNENGELKSRKFWGFAVIVGCATAATIFGKVAPNDWMSLVTYVFGIYVAGNVGEHVAKAFKK